MMWFKLIVKVFVRIASHEKVWHMLICRMNTMNALSAIILFIKKGIPFNVSNSKITNGKNDNMGQLNFAFNFIATLFKMTFNGFECRHWNEINILFLQNCIWYCIRTQHMIMYLQNYSIYDFFFISNSEYSLAKQFKWMITPFWRKYICMFKNLMQKTNRNRRTKSWYYNFHILSICKIVFTSYKHMEQISIHNKSSHVRENKIISAAHTVCCQFIDRKYCK